MVETNLYSLVSYLVELEVAAGTTGFIERNVYMIAQAFGVLE